MAIVTFESVAAAADTLQATGQRASVRAVIASLGGGSPNAVLRLLAEYKAGRPVVRINDTELDLRITDAIRVQMQRVSEQAAQAAEERAAGIDDDLQALAEAQAAAELQIATLTAERDTAQAQVANFFEQLKITQDEAERAAEQSAQAVAAVRSDLAGERARQEQAAAALARAEVRLEALPALQAEVERLRAALDASQQARTSAEQSAAVLVAKLEAADRRAEDADVRTAKVDARADALATELARVNAALQACQARIETSVRDSADDAKKLGQVVQELADLKRQAQTVAAVKPAPEAGQGALEL